jgi:membrane protease YdiL (CAAX protease family)
VGNTATQDAPIDPGNSGFRSQEPTGSLTAILVFFALAFGWSWGIGIAAVKVSPQMPFLSTALMIVAGFGPSLAAVAVVAKVSTGVGLRDWFARCLNWRVGWRWFAFAFALPPTVMMTAIALHGLMGGPMPSSPALDQIPVAMLNFGLVLVVGGPLGEEFGWRGYALPALAARLDWRTASLIIGAVWGAWHLPLFYLVSSAQSHMMMPIFMLNILAGSVVFAWLFERTQHSVLPALVLHTSINAWTAIIDIVPTAATGQPFTLTTGLMVLIAMALLLADSVPRWLDPIARIHRNPEGTRARGSLQQTDQGAVDADI